jgi:hypothetical protein
LTLSALQIDASNFFIWKSSILSRLLSSAGASGYRPLPAAYGSVIQCSLFGGRRLSVDLYTGIFVGSIKLFWSAVSGLFLRHQDDAGYYANFISVLALMEIEPTLS